VDWKGGGIGDGEGRRGRGNGAFLGLKVENFEK
jgi:hypothetical protein